MNTSVRQKREIIVKDGTIRTIYNIPYNYETDCHKHQQSNVISRDISKSDGIKEYIVCIEYYIK